MNQTIPKFKINMQMWSMQCEFAIDMKNSNQCELDFIWNRLCNCNNATVLCDLIYHSNS